jgi:glycosyltransferase involved in cell wall biosynthesis
MTKISYAITVCDELFELQRLLSVLRTGARSEDEIVIQYDTPRTPPRVKAYLQTLDNVRLASFDLNDDFAAFKNHLKQACRGDYIFQIDADEYPAPHLLKSLPKILQDNPASDVIALPRINTVEGLTPQHVQRWGWSVDELGRINFPDWQMRVLRNVAGIQWEGRVHEQVTGFNLGNACPPEPDFALFHPKTIARQERQNDLYEKLATANI